jgi:hypothetical protein
MEAIAELAVCAQDGVFLTDCRIAFHLDAGTLSAECQRCLSM